MSLSFKPVVLSALVLAFASLGDAFLYTAVPVNHEYLNIPVVWIGFLLSVNRFVRLFANQLCAYWFHRFGVKRTTMLAALLAVLTTAGYGLATDIVIWILARVIWGFCFAALRISSTSYSVQHNRQALGLGVSKGLQELGPVLGLLAGPLLLRSTDPATTFLLLSLASVPAVLLAGFLPEWKPAASAWRFSFGLIPSSFNLLTFVSFFFVQGVLVVTLARILDASRLIAEELTLAAGAYLAFRRVCIVIIAPLGGMMAEGWGGEKVYLAAYLLTVLGLLSIAMGYPEAGIVTAFTFNSITAALGPKNVLEGPGNYLKEVAVNSTWADTGAALGTLAGGFVFFAAAPGFALIIGTLVMLGAWVYHVKTTKFQTKQLLKWK